MAIVNHYIRLLWFMLDDPQTLRFKFAKGGLQKMEFDFQHAHELEGDLSQELTKETSCQGTGGLRYPCRSMRNLRKGRATSFEKKILPIFAGIQANA